jgi:hypothetical protein
MNPLPRNKVLVQVRLTAAERDRWVKAALAEELRLGELVRAATRDRVRDVELRRLLAARESVPVRPSAA